jgi:hypothetical protein
MESEERGGGCFTAIFHIVVTLPLSIVAGIIVTVYQLFIFPYKKD